MEDISVCMLLVAAGTTANALDACRRVCERTGFLEAVWREGILELDLQTCCALDCRPKCTKYMGFPGGQNRISLNPLV